MREPSNIRPAVLAALSLTASCGASAATENGIELDQFTVPVVVAATRTVTPANQVASSVTVITADEIAAKQERTLTDVLRDVPGLNLVQSGGTGAQASVASSPRTTTAGLSRS